MQFNNLLGAFKDSQDNSLVSLFSAQYLMTDEQKSVVDLLEALPRIAIRTGRAVDNASDRVIADKSILANEENRLMRLTS